jgi:hypothetical protein
VTDRLRSNLPASVPSGSRLEDRAASSKRPDPAVSGMTHPRP